MSEIGTFKPAPIARPDDDSWSFMPSEQFLEKLKSTLPELDGIENNCVFRYLVANSNREFRRGSSFTFWLFWIFAILALSKLAPWWIGIIVGLVGAVFVSPIAGGPNRLAYARDVFVDLWVTPVNAKDILLGIVGANSGTVNRWVLCKWNLLYMLAAVFLFLLDAWNYAGRMLLALLIITASSRTIMYAFSPMPHIGWIRTMIEDVYGKTLSFRTYVSLKEIRRMHRQFWASIIHGWWFVLWMMAHQLVTQEGLKGVRWAILIGLTSGIGYVILNRRAGRNFPEMESHIQSIWESDINKLNCTKAL